jgi:hypothetical protein
MLTEYAKREEIPEMAAFIDSAWRAAYRHILAPAYLVSMRVEERIKGLLERFDSNHSQFLRMRDDSGIVGVAVFGRSFTDGYPDDGEVSALYLRLDCIGKGRIYVVEPTGAFEDDPNLTDKKYPGNPTLSFRTKESLRIVDEVPQWKGHPQEVLQNMLDGIARAKEQGVEAINE